MLRLFDTMAGRKVDFEPAVPGRVSIYVCGPTVYEVPHLGHGRYAVVFDVMRRYFEWSGYAVSYVSNVTDVEDKIIARAAQEGATESDIADRYTKAVLHELDRLGVRRPDAEPHATEFIDQMQVLIAELVARGHAYVIEGEGVYFGVETYPGYGDLSHRRMEDLVDAAGARVVIDERKRSPVDFALWKAAKPGEPAWDSPWGPGRPGWHIECSAMSLEILGEGFDIHGGGDDLVFPHHENERAQAEAAGHRFARYWVHNGMVMVGGEKMSKSLGNYTTLADALDAHGPRAFRLAVLQTHYRSQMELGRAVLVAAEKAVHRLDALVRAARAAGVEWENVASDHELVAAFRTAMDDDFGTPAALGAIFEGVKAAHVAIDGDDPARAASLVAAVAESTAAVGIGIVGRAERAERAERSDGAEGAEGVEDAAEIDALVELRDAARRARDFAAADRLRDELRDRGVTLEDTPGGTIWHR